MIRCRFPNSTYTNLSINYQRCGRAAKIAHSEINELLKSPSKQKSLTLELHNLELFGHRLQRRLDKSPMTTEVDHV